MASRREQVASKTAAPPAERRAVKPRALVVAGMQHGGSAAVARCISLLGATLPRTPAPPEREGEIQWGQSAPIVDLHQELLTLVGSSWDDISAFPEAFYRSTDAARYRRRMVQVVDSEYAGARMFVVNDQRLCRLIPFWAGVLDDLDVQPAFLLPLREPIEVALRLERHHRTPTAKGVLSWLRHVLDAERDTREYPRAFVAHDDLLRDWRSSTRTIAEAVELNWPVPESQAEAGIDVFLSSYQGDHTFPREILGRHGDAVPWAGEAYELLLDACRSGGSPEYEALDRLGGSLAETERAYRPVLVESRLRASALEGRLDRLAARDREHSEIERDLKDRFSKLEGNLKDRLFTLEADLKNADRKIAFLTKQLTSIRRSTSWRITKPLRAANPWAKRRASRGLE